LLLAMQSAAAVLLLLLLLILLLQLKPARRLCPLHHWTQSLVV
jgi:hypothetical protein